jgi:hypothetical protein
MFPYFLKKTHFKALFAGLVPVLLTGLALSTALIFTGCPTGGNPETQTEGENITITFVDPDTLSVDIIPSPVRDASQVTFTVSGNYHDYQWFLDSDKLNETSASLILHKNVLGTDPHHITVTALDAGNTPYSGAVLFQFN